MSLFGDVWRHTFPRGLQYCKQCIVLHSTMTSIVKRYKHKRYIPRHELQDAVDSFIPMPGAPVLCLPIVRHVLLVRWINTVRVAVFSRPAWLFTLNVAKEHKKITEWLANDLKGIQNRKLEKFVDREKFQKEVLGNFHVAAMFHRVFRAGIVLCMFLTSLILLELLFAQWFYAYLRFWCGMDDSAMLEYFREVTERHAVSDVPPSYAGKLPSPCALIEEGGRGRYVMEVCEFISPDESKRVVFVPTPCVGERSFFEAVGAVARKCDAILLEGVPETYLHRVAPAFLLPMQVPTFAAFHLHHKYFDILHNNKQEPPKLCAAAATITMSQFVVQSVVPMTLRYVLQPALVSGSKSEAKTAWSYLKELLEDDEMLQKSPEGAAGGDDHYSICVPWSVGQIVNLEASLVKMGYRLHRHYPIPWLHEGYIGEHFLGRNVVIS